MPVSGLPTMLECILDNILQESKLASFKIAGNQQRTTLVLRFDAIADTCVSENRHSTPASFRRKPPSQQQRDKQRKQLYISSISAEKHETTIQQSKKEIDIENNDMTKADTDSVTTDNIDSTKLNNTSHNKDKIDNTPHERDSQYNTLDRTTSDDETDDDSFTEHTKKQQSQRSTTEIQHSTTHQLHDDTADSTDDELTNPQKSTHQLHDDTADSTDDELTNPQKSTHNIENQDDSCIAALCKTFLQCDEIQIRLQSLSFMKETLQHVTKPDRNNNITKLLVDRYGPTHVILAETEDLIIEYDTGTEKITNFVVKDGDLYSPYERMRCRHMKTWTDQTEFVRAEYHDDVQNIMTAIPLLKRYIEP